MGSFCSNCQELTEDQVVKSFWPTNQNLIQVTINCVKCTLLKHQSVEERTEDDR